MTRLPHRFLHLLTLCLLAACGQASEDPGKAPAKGAASEGDIACGDTVRVTLEGSSASCRRLDNLPDCAAERCEAIPYTLRFNSTGELDFLTESGDQCAAYQCDVQWQPAEVPVRATAEQLRAPGKPPAGVEFSAVPATEVRYLDDDALFLLQPCRGTPVFADGGLARFEDSERRPLGANPDGAGLNYPDFSVAGEQSKGLPNEVGAQYACSLARSLRIVGDELYQAVDEIYLQGDIRFQRSAN